MKEQSHKSEMRAALRGDFERLRARRRDVDDPVGSAATAAQPAGALHAGPDRRSVARLGARASWLGATAAIAGVARAGRLCCTSRMKREEREQILRQGVVAPETPRDRRDRAALAEDMQASGLHGRALRLRLRNFRPSADGYLSALGGPLPFMVRLRTITEMTAEHERRLGEAWRELAATGLDDEAFAAAWRAEVAAWSFDEVNDLIDRHNRFYPAESRLPMDPRTRDYALVGGEDYRRQAARCRVGARAVPGARRALSRRLRRAAAAGSRAG